jgi:putative toxin-antitoxin system antitoxin component (TIGR02293 family)
MSPQQEDPVASTKFVPTRAASPVLGARTLGLTISTEFEAAARINAGLPSSTIHALATHLNRPNKYVLVVTDIPESTFHARQKTRKPLSPEASSRVYHVARAVEAANEYFAGDKDAAQRWLTHPKVALGGETPVEFARTPPGSDYVVNLLNRMAHGIIS